MSKHLSRRRGRGSDEDSVGSRLTFFAVGATVGAVVALLFAPKSGRELREDLADATRKGVDRARETGTQLGAKAGEYYDAASERARELAVRRGETLSAAIEAGREAYREEKRRTETSVIAQPPAGGGNP
jgi:gas vesicle protein